MFYYKILHYKEIIYAQISSAQFRANSVSSCAFLCVNYFIKVNIKYTECNKIALLDINLEEFLSEFFKWWL